MPERTKKHIGKIGRYYPVQDLPAERIARQVRDAKREWLRVNGLEHRDDDPLDTRGHTPVVGRAFWKGALWAGVLLFLAFAVIKKLTTN